ncbi:MAG: hypothetical protein IPM17_13565 [Verrucomicrobia bacterium]|jgi:uncharacterized protein YggT (Ycf19 family)|nr:hypothetical protein [Verrucomicrobiota bacterium]
MNWVDLLLNLAGLGLWLAWRSAGFAARQSLRGASAPWLRQITPASRHRWVWLVALVILLAGRGWLYAQFGPEVNWIATLDLGIVEFPFKSVSVARMAAFSFLSFAVFLGGFYLWLLFLSSVNRGTADSLTWQRAIRRQLGWLDGWPWLLKLVGPWLLVMLVWYLVNPALVEQGMAVAPRSAVQLWKQGALVGVGTVVCWKYLIGLVLLLHIVNSFLYLGSSEFWMFITVTARNLLRPLGGLPLRVGGIDFSPVVAIALTFLALEFAERALRAAFVAQPL